MALRYSRARVMQTGAWVDIYACDTPEELPEVNVVNGAFGIITGVGPDLVYYIRQDDEWSIQANVGAQGPQGAQGIQGETGPQGPQGDPGAGGASDWGDLGGTLSNQTDLQTALDAKAVTSRQIISGNGLTGGGDLSADRTLAVGAGAGITVAADAISVDQSVLKIDDFAAGDDNTDLNASTAKHGLCPKLSNVATEFLNGTGAFSTPAAPTTGIVLSKQVILTHAQILGISTTPVEIIPAPGAGKLISVIGAHSIKQTTAGGYASNPNWSLRYNGVATDLTTALSLTITSADKRYRKWTGVDHNFTAPSFNTSVVVRGSADTTTGNAANYVVVEVFYTIITDGP